MLKKRLHPGRQKLMKIAICDDSYEFACQLKEKLESICAKLDWQMEATVFSWVRIPHWHRPIGIIAKISIRTPPAIAEGNTLGKKLPSIGLLEGSKDNRNPPIPMIACSKM